MPEWVTEWFARARDCEGSRPDDAPPTVPQSGVLLTELLCATAYGPDQDIRADYTRSVQTPWDPEIGVTCKATVISRSARYPPDRGLSLTRRWRGRGQVREKTDSRVKRWRPT